jgi:lysozyme
MTGDALQRLKARVSEHEAERLFVYDDATGKPIVKGSVVQGHPTIGIGRNLAGRGITKAESAAFFDRDIAETIDEVRAAFPWTMRLNPARFSVVVEMNFQIGLAGLKKFVNTLRDMRNGDYDDAADGMLASKWARIDSPARAQRLARVMRTGEWS